MRRTPILLLATLAGAAGVSAVAGAQGAPPRAKAGAATTVELAHTRLGSILTSAAGHTLYEFARDPASQDTCVKISGCSSFWPPLKASGRPSAGAGVRASLLSTIALPGGTRQVTYAGHPLYLYSGDSGPRETSYVGVKRFGGAWDALNASGGLVK